MEKFAKALGLHAEPEELTIKAKDITWEGSDCYAESVIR